MMTDWMDADRDTKNALETWIDMLTSKQVGDDVKSDYNRPLVELEWDRSEEVAQEAVWALGGPIAAAVVCGVPLSVLKLMMEHWGSTRPTWALPLVDEQRLVALGSAYWVYVIQSLAQRVTKRGRSAPGFYYVGMTTDPRRRIREHNGELRGGGRYTSKHRPWVPRALYGPYESRSEALRAEGTLKRSKRGIARTTWSEADSPLCKISRWEIS